MRLKNKDNGGLVEVSDELGARLIAQGTWVEDKHKATRKPKPAPAEEPVVEDAVEEA